MKKILVVDDEPDLREVLSEELGKWEVHLAEHGLEGLEKAIAISPDIILTDVNMPVMDGLAMLEALRFKNIDIPCIVMTAFSDKEKIRKAWEFGAFDFLEKPVRSQQLLSVVTNALEFGTKVQMTRRVKEVTLTFDLSTYDALVKASEGETLPEWIVKVLRERFL